MRTTAWSWLEVPYKRAERAELCKQQCRQELNISMAWTMGRQLTGEQYCWKRGSVISLVGWPDNILVEQRFSLQEFFLLSVVSASG